MFRAFSRPSSRSSLTAVAASGFTFVSWWQSCSVRGRASRPDHEQIRLHQVGDIFELNIKLRCQKVKDLHFSPNIVRVMKSRRIRWAGHVARMGEKKVVCSVLCETWGKETAADHSPPSCAKVKKEWSLTPTLPFRLRGVYRDFIFVFCHCRTPQSRSFHIHTIYYNKMEHAQNCEVTILELFALFTRI
jgi:hypothetical protein